MIVQRRSVGAQPATPVGARRAWALVLVALAACGPAGPGRPPDTSPLSTRAEAAQLPTLGSAFEDRPVTPAEQVGGGHMMHGGHPMPASEPPDAGAGEHEGHESAPEQQPPPESDRPQHGGHGGHHDAP